MATSSRIYSIALGSPTVVGDTTVILGSGSAGTPGARRRLVHPDAENFPPIVYGPNPTRTLNLDNDVLTSPAVSIVVTAGSTRLVEFDRSLEDTLVTEVWSASRGQAAMPTYLFRQLYEYWRNRPPFDANNQTYITWEPRDRNAFTYNVQLARLAVGRGGDGQEFDVSDFRAPGGADIANALDDLDVTPTGLVDAQVTLVMKVVSKV